MGVKALYEAIGGSYDIIIGRLHDENMIKIFLNSFFEDDTYDNLVRAMDAHDAKAAFEMAHTLKGVALNLELGALAKSASALTEALRGGDSPEAPALYAAVQRDYKHTVDTLHAALG